MLNTLLPVSVILLAACSEDHKPEDTGPFDTGEDCEEGSWFADADGDGFGDPASETLSCEQPSGTVEDSSDCDDASEVVFPGAEELCGDGVVNDCEGSVAEAMAACPTSWDLEAAESHSGSLAFSGWSLAMDGDVDGDGVDELLLGAPDLWSEASGEARLISQGAELAKFTGQSADAHFGAAVELIDSDGDGAAEVLIGAPMPWAEGAGAAYLFSSPSGALSEADADSVLIGDGDSAFGGDMAHGDVDGDGTPDLLVGARYWYDGEASIGRAYLLLGPLDDKHAMADGDYDGALAGSGGSYREFGGAVATGDVDGDGVDDVLVGERYGMDSSGEVARGRVYVFLGGEAPEGAAADADAVLYGETAYESFGAALATADVDGDGTQDLLVGAPYGPDSSNEGQGGNVRVFHGADDTEADAVLLGENRSQAGHALASAGDRDLDGLDDILVGAPYDTSGESSGTGSAYLVLGGLTGTASLEEAASESVSSENEALGASVASGDVDGDGVPDAGVGAPFRASLGEVLILPGAAF